MKNVIKKSLQSLLLVPALALGVSAVAPVLQPSVVSADTASCATPSQGGVANGAKCAQGNDTPENLFGDKGIFNTIVNTLLFIIGAVAVIMLIYGGFRYVVSGGDSSAITSAKNTILYACIGIIIAILAYAVVNFVITNIGT